MGVIWIPADGNDRMRYPGTMIYYEIYTEAYSTPPAYPDLVKLAQVLIKRCAPKIETVLGYARPPKKCPADWTAGSG